MDDRMDPETGEILEPEVVSLSVVQAQEAAMIDVAVRTAKSYPRTIKAFQRDLESWSCASPEIAAECFYTLERNKKGGGKAVIIGPSIRFAELLQAAYTNIVVTSEIVEEAERYVVVQASVRDMERNLGTRLQVRRSIWGKYGRFSEDMIQTTVNAATSLAIRNCVVRVVPKALWLGIWERAKEVARGKAASLEERKTTAEKALASVGIQSERCLAFLGKPSWKDVDADDLLALQVIYREVRNGERDPSTVGVDAPVPPTEEAKAAEEAIQKGRKATGKKAKATAPKPPEPEPEPEQAAEPEAKQDGGAVQEGMI